MSRPPTTPPPHDGVPAPGRAASPAPLLTPRGETLSVAHLSAEYFPYARTGGLAEAVTGLASFQQAQGVAVTVLLPLYRTVRDEAPDLEPVGPPIRVPLGARVEEARIFRIAGDASGPRVFFVEHLDFFNRAGIYGEQGRDYPDNARRFAFFALASCLALPRVVPGPVLVHAHDWHTALAPVYLRTLLADEPWARDALAVLSVHNPGYQGHFGPEAMLEIGLPVELYNWRQLEWYGKVNFLKGGLTFADCAITVSPSQAAELRTPGGGFGLHDTYMALGDRLVGILNGIDQEVWDPATDPQIQARYGGTDHLEGKRRCKAALQRSYGLPEQPDTPLFGMTGRLVQQKGLDLILGSRHLLQEDAQFVFLGSGDPRYEEAIAGLARAAPQRIGVQLAFRDSLEHRLMAGVDLLLMPSLYEPCGLTQMRAQRYGSPPVARRVGGLADTIEDEVTGFLFDAYEATALEEAAFRALAAYSRPADWTRMMRAAMARDFSWAPSVAAYIDVYRRAVTRGPRA